MLKKKLQHIISIILAALMLLSNVTAYTSLAGEGDLAYLALDETAENETAEAQDWVEPETWEEAEIWAEPEPETEAWAGPETEIETEAEVWAEPETEVEIESETWIEPEPEVETESETWAELETELETEPEALLIEEEPTTALVWQTLEVYPQNSYVGDYPAYEDLWYWISACWSRMYYRGAAAQPGASWTKISISGYLPEGAYAAAEIIELAEEHIYEEYGLFAYRIWIYDASGREYTPDFGALRITIDNSRILNTWYDGQEIRVYDSVTVSSDGTPLRNYSAYVDWSGVAFDVSKFPVNVIVTAYAPIVMEEETTAEPEIVIEEATAAEAEVVTEEETTAEAEVVTEEVTAAEAEVVTEEETTEELEIVTEEEIAAEAEVVTEEETTEELEIVVEEATAADLEIETEEATAEEPESTAERVIYIMEIVTTEESLPENETAADDATVETEAETEGGIAAEFESTVEREIYFLEEPTTEESFPENETATEELTTEPVTEGEAVTEEESTAEPETVEETVLEDETATDLINEETSPTAFGIDEIIASAETEVEETDEADGEDGENEEAAPTAFGIDEIIASAETEVEEADGADDEDDENDEVAPTAFGIDQIIESAESVEDSDSDMEDTEDIDIEEAGEETSPTAFGIDEIIASAETEAEETASTILLENQTIYAGEDVYLTGLMPVGSIVEAVPVNVELDGQIVLAAYDIAIYADEEHREAGDAWIPGAAADFTQVQGRPQSVELMQEQSQFSDAAEASELYQPQSQDLPKDQIEYQMQDQNQLQAQDQAQDQAQNKDKDKDKDVPVLSVSILNNLGMGALKSAIIQLVDELEGGQNSSQKEEAKAASAFMAERESIDDDAEVQYPGSEN